MKLTNQQALILFEITKDTLQFAGTFGGFDRNRRRVTVNNILNQQSKKLIELTPKKRAR